MPKRRHRFFQKDGAFRPFAVESCVGKDDDATGGAAGRSTTPRRQSWQTEITNEFFQAWGIYRPVGFRLWIGSEVEP